MKMKNRPLQHRARGFTVTEAVFAASVIAIIAGLLSVAIDRHQTFAARSADRRAAAWHIEGLMTQLQMSPAQEFDAGPGLAGIEMTVLDDPSPVGHAWVRLTEDTSNGEVTMVGLVLRANLKTESTTDESN